MSRPTERETLYEFRQRLTNVDYDTLAGWLYEDAQELDRVRTLQLRVCRALGISSGYACSDELVHSIEMMVNLLQKDAETISI